MGKGIFLLDAIYEPINQIKDKKLRRSRIIDVYPQLKKNINALPLEDKAKILLIHKNVIEAIGERLREDFRKYGYKFYDIGFPRFYNDEEFRFDIKRAIQN